MIEHSYDADTAREKSRWATPRPRDISARSAAERALRDLDAEGAQVSFQAVARRAGVSRQWLYTQPALRAEIERLRDRPSPIADGVPARQRATEASLRQRREMVRAENQATARREHQPQDRTRPRLWPTAGGRLTLRR
jgi:Family of unknown function (DUF6262)